MVNPIDIAWLAGVFDGEGCVRVTWTRRKSPRKASPQVSLAIVNTSQPLLLRAVQCIEQLGVRPKVYAMFEPQTKLGKKPCSVLVVSRKKDVLLVAEALEQHATAKKEELQMAIWYLRRSCRVWQHKVSADETQVLDSLKLLKRGEKLPEDVRKILKN